MKKLMLLTANGGIPGTYGGQIQLSMLLSEVRMTDHEIADARGFGRGKQNSRYILSLRDDISIESIPSSRASYTKSFTLGSAKADVVDERTVGNARKVRVSIESPDQCDFTALHNAVYYNWLGIPHQELPVPVPRFQRISFVAGLSNDFRNLGTWLKGRWVRARLSQFLGVALALVALIAIIAGFVYLSKNTYVERHVAGSATWVKPHEIGCINLVPVSISVWESMVNPSRIRKATIDGVEYHFLGKIMDDDERVCKDGVVIHLNKT